MKIRLALLTLGVFTGLAVTAATNEVRVRFTDSATGFGVSTDDIVVEALAADGTKQRVAQSSAATFRLGQGRFSIAANLPDHNPVATVVDTATLDGYNLEFKLDPLVLPAEVQPENVQALQREGYTLIQGYVADGEAGTPLKGVSVISQPDGAQTRTDEGGFFRFYVAVPSDDSQPKPSLILQKNGYRAEERQNLELWSRGDWTYRIALQRGEGTSVVDENTQRRRGPKTAPANDAAEMKTTPEQFAALFPNSGPQLMSTAASNATVRVPRNIRVQNQSSVVEYVTMDYYVKHSLPAEWISGWASFAGGSNSMNAGAVAVRCYAIARMVGVSATSTFDICATTTCQVYGTATSSAADTAANFTANYVVVNGSGVIITTEYSSENNQEGMACGDGFTAPTGGCLYDPVCTGEPEFGHGRGMCQWGTAKWATGRKFTGNSTGNATLNGFPRQDWKWIVNHYYPGNTLAKGAPLVIGDDVRVIGSSAQTVRMCGDGSISSGTTCPAVTTKAVGSIGVIIDGPVLVTADGNGFTWYKVQWSDSTIGWTPENWLERSLAVPLAPTALTATATATNQINLTWVDNSTNELGFKIERALSAGGAWTQIDTVMANTNSYADTNGLAAGTTYFYRVRAFTFSNSGYSNTTNATTQSQLSPFVTSQPWSQVKGLGQTVTFLVASGGVTPLNYQWRRFGTNLSNGGNISGVTATNLTITGLKAADAGNYTVVITNASGATTSAEAVLTVSGIIAFQDDFDANTAASWRTNRTSTDTAVTFNYNYAADGIAASPHAVGGTTRAVKMEANMNLAATAAINISPFGQGFIGDYKLRFDMWINANGPFPAGGTGSSQFVTAGVGTTGGNTQWNGAGSTADGVWFSVDGEGQGTDTAATADFNAFIGPTIQPVATGVYAAGTASNARGNLNAYYATKFPGGQTPPYFQQTNYAQQTGALEVGTVGFVWRQVLINKTGNVVEWYIDDFKIAAITNATLAGTNVFVGYWDPFTSLSDNDALSFGLVDNVRVEVPAILPNITTGPQPRTNAVGTSATFTVAATGFPAPGYQWRFNGVNIGGATASSYTIGSVTTNDAGGYSVLVTNLAGSVTSSVVALTVIAPPTISVPPADQFVAAGADASFSVTAGGSAPLSYQWYLNGNSLSGATQSVYTKLGAQTIDAGSYTVVVTNSSGAVTSAPALLVVNNPPSLPAIGNKIVHAGVALSFTNVATDPDVTNTLSYSLDGGAPGAASIGASSGVFAWQTSDADAGTTNSVTVRVVDNGVPPLNDAKSFTVTVLSRPSVQGAEISGGNFVMIWSAIPGMTYRVQFKGNLDDASWTDLTPDVVAAGATASKSDPVGGGQRFYRVVVVGM